MMDENEETQQHNMISNLPLLFANGYPTSLDKITESQLQNFIPFMVQCSLGHINLPGKIDYSEPEWWPEEVSYILPFAKPRKFAGNWLEKMKTIVQICYRFHKSSFLLRFCKDLASYEHASLRFINNYNSTTSLYDRRSNKLLVTFRNENMSYDQPQRSRKCLLQQKSKTQSDFSNQQHMVEPAPFDIYLCDNCDAELYSHDAILEHEKTCTLDDDVIICDSPEPEEVQLNLSHTSTENKEQREAFFLNFNLQSKDSTSRSPLELSSLPNNVDKTKEANDDNVVAEKLKRLPRRNRAVHSLSRCPTIPLSSPAGNILIKTAKTLMTDEYLLERLDRMERFCHAPAISKAAIRPKYLDKKFVPSNINCTFKKPQDYQSQRGYNFPRRQFSIKRRFENSMFLNALLMRRCRPMSIRLKKISESEIKRKRQHNNKLNIKLTRDTSRSSNWKISSSPEVIVDTIDLCSSDEEGSSKGQSDSKRSKAANPDLREIIHRLNSEITLTPISKDNNKKIVASQSATPEDFALVATNTYQGNFVVSPSPLLANDTSTSKALQPSVLYFSNYTARSIPINPCPTTNNNDISASFNASQLESFQNQENFDNSRSKGDGDWFQSNPATSTPNTSTTNHNRRPDRTGSNTRTSMPIMQFNSPNRVVSIDLTS